MVYNNVFLKAKNADAITELADLLRAQAEVSLTEPGCQRFEVYHSSSDPRAFILVEWWTTQADLDAHKETKNFVDVYRAKVLPLVDRVAHPSTKLI